eukprot:PhM_4_TR925/c0_g1_i1/m.35664
MKRSRTATTTISSSSSSRHQHLPCTDLSVLADTDVMRSLKPEHDDELLTISNPSPIYFFQLSRALWNHKRKAKTLRRAVVTAFFEMNTDLGDADYLSSEDALERHIEECFIDENSTCASSGLNGVYLAWEPPIPRQHKGQYVACVIVEPVERASRLMSYDEQAFEVERVLSSTSSSHSLVEEQQRDGSVTPPLYNIGKDVDQPVEVWAQQPHAMSAIFECQGSCLGVRKIWVKKSHQRRGLATMLLDVARTHFFYGFNVPREYVCFHQPTTSGKILAATYTRRRDFLVYNTM